jgi:hypothetical protein
MDVRKPDNRNVHRSQPQESSKKGISANVSSLAQKVQALPPIKIDSNTQKHTYSLNPELDKAKMAKCFSRTLKK